MMLKGMTAQYLIRQTYKINEDDTILFHAAAGGVGSSRANGPSRWARPSSAPSAATRKPNSPRPTAATIPSSTRVRTSSSG